jgi:DnaK suppressor protein
MLQELRAQPHGDMADFALDTAQDEISSQLAEVESRELAKLENALASIREGVYGQCEDCGEAIPLARLHALPYATHCIQCQREAEKGGGYRSKPDWGRMADAVVMDVDAPVPDLEPDYP